MAAQSSRALQSALALAAGALLATLVMVGRSRLPFELAAALPEGLREVRWPIVGSLALAATATTAVPGELSPRPAAYWWPLSLATICLSVMALAALWSPLPPTDAAYRSFEVVAILLGTISVARMSWRAEDSAPLTSGFLLGLLLLCVPLMCLGLAQTLTGSTGRVAVLGGGPIVFGRFMAMLALLMLAPLPVRVPYWARVAIGAPAVVLLLLSGSRGSLLAFIVSAVALVWVSESRPNPRALVRSVAHLTVATAVVVALSWNRVVEIVQRRFIANVIERLNPSGRDEIAGRAVELIRDNPLAGAGLGAFPATGKHAYAHNLFLEVALTAGPIISVSLAIAIAATAFHAWRYRPHPAVAGIFFLILASAQFSGDLWDSRAVFLLMPMLLTHRLHSQASPTRSQHVLSEPLHTRVTR